MHMFNGKWEIIEQEVFGSWNVRVYLVFHDGATPKLAYIREGKVELEEIRGFEPEREPTFNFPIDLWEALKSKLTEHHERDTHVVEAELGATKKHLKDMRTLVFKRKEGKL